MLLNADSVLSSVPSKLIKALTPTGVSTVPAETETGIMYLVSKSGLAQNLFVFGCCGGKVVPVRNAIFPICEQFSNVDPELYANGKIVGILINTQINPSKNLYGILIYRNIQEPDNKVRQPCLGYNNH